MGLWDLGKKMMTTPFRMGARAMEGGAKVAGAMLETGADIATGRQDPLSATAEGMRDVAKATFETGFEVAKEPLRTLSRGVDLATGQDDIDLDDAHVVHGPSVDAFVAEFLSNPTALSPIGVDVHRVSDVMYGRPFPGGPKLGIQIHSRQDRELAGGLQQTTLELEYLGEEIHGKGRLIVTDRGDGSLEVRDQWIDVQNEAPFPTVFQENLHHFIAGAGLDAIAKRAMKREQ